MQATSAAWKALWAGGSARLEAVAKIGGVEYTAISPPVISRALVQDGLSLGGAVSATCRFSVLDPGQIPRSAAVSVRMRLTDGEAASEWLPAGTFYIGHRTRDPVTGLVTLECYDALLKANALWEDDGGSWPRDMAALAGTLAARLGVELDARNAIRTGAIYVLDAPEAGTTLRDLLERIAAANGGSWIMSPENRLRLVPLLPGEDADAVAAVAVTGSIGVSEAGVLTGIRYTVEDVNYITGDASGVVAEARVTVPVAVELAEALLGARYQAYELRGAIYDPAAELGDRLLAGANGEVDGVLYAETATLGPAFRGDLSAPEAGEVSDEYPYIGERAHTLRALRASVQALDEAKASVEYVDGAVSGLVTSVATEYAQSQSAEVAPGEDAGWGLVAPAWREGWYIWQRTATTTAQGVSYSDPVCVSGRDGEPGTVLRIDSSRGTVFKNNAVSTVLSVTVYHGGERITDIAGLRRVFGAGARLSWQWQRMDEDRYGALSAGDARIGDDGFTLTLSPEDVDVKVTFMCELIV